MALRAVEYVLHSTQHTGLTITRVAFMGTHVTSLEHHYTWLIAATISNTIEIFHVLQDSLGIGVVLALDRQPRQHITLHQLKELGP